MAGLQDLLNFREDQSADIGYTPSQIAERRQNVQDDIVSNAGRGRLTASQRKVQAQATGLRAAAKNLYRTGSTEQQALYDQARTFDELNRKTLTKSARTAALGQLTKSAFGPYADEQSDLNTEQAARARAETAAAAEQPAAPSGAARQSARSAKRDKDYAAAVGTANSFRPTAASISRTRTGMQNEPRATITNSGGSYLPAPSRETAPVSLSTGTPTSARTLLTAETGDA